MKNVKLIVACLALLPASALCQFVYSLFDTAATMNFRGKPKHVQISYTALVALPPEVLEFNRDGQLISLKSPVNKRIEYKDGAPVDLINSTPDEELTVHHVVTKLDARGKPLLTRKYFETAYNRAQVGATIYQNRERSTLIKEFSIEGEKLDLVDTTLVEYTDSGAIASIQRQSRIQTGPKIKTIESKESYEYTNGVLVGIEVGRQADNTLFTEIQLDDCGNWIRRVRNQNGEQLAYTQTIEYHEVCSKSRDAAKKQ